LFQQHEATLFGIRSTSKLHPPPYRVLPRVLPLYKCLESISEISSKEAERNGEEEGRSVIEI